MKKHKSEKQDTKDGTLVEDENDNENGNEHENDNENDNEKPADTRSSSTTTTTTTPTEILTPKTVDSTENNKSAETTTFPALEQNEIQNNKKEEQPTPVVQEILKVEEKPTPVAESYPVEQKPESASPPIEEPKTEEPQQIKSPEESINTVNS